MNRKILLTLILVALLISGLAWLGANQIDLFHVSFFNQCARHVYEFQLLDEQRLSHFVQYDFVGSPTSLLLVVVWIESGPAINLREPIPLTCAIHP
jgi:hypothetical protein